MGLFKRKQVWWMSFTYQGRQIRQSTETRKKKLAEKVLRKILIRIDEDRFFDVLQERERTLGDLMTRYRSECSINKVPQSQARDGQMLNHLLPHFGADTALIDITPRLINAYKAKRRHAGAAPATINKEVGLLSHAFNVAIREWEWCRDNPVQRVRMESVNNQIERWLTTKEEERLLAASPPWLQAIMTFALHTGLRRSEILNLQWQDIDFVRGTLVVMKSKNKQRRTIPLNGKVFELLVVKQQHHNQESPFVFITSTGTPIGPRNLTRGFQSARKKADIQDFRFHDLRHTVATRLVQAGIDLYQVQRLLGHKKPDMTQRYAHHCPESLREGVEVLTRRVVSHFYHTPLKIKGEESVSV